MSLLNPIYLFPTLILAIGVIDDVARRKVNNKLNAVLLLLSIVFVVVYFGASGLKMSLLAALSAFALTLPLFVVRALGGGDVKLFIVFAFATLSPTAVFWTLLFSFVCGAILGLFRVIFQGNFMQLLHNLFAIITFNKAENIKYHKIPYTVALLMGWLTYITFMTSKGGVL